MSVANVVQQQPQAPRSVCHEEPREEPPAKSATLSRKGCSSVRSSAPLRVRLECAQTMAVASSPQNIACPDALIGVDMVLDFGNCCTTLCTPFADS